MPHMPKLRVVPLESIRRHEEVDPFRVDRLSGRIADEGIQVNPMVCCEAPSGELVLLDGATRTESLKRIGLPHAVVQLVEPGAVTLETWHHVVRGCEPAELMSAVAARSELILSDAPGTPRLHLKDGQSNLVEGLGVSDNAALSALVNGYVGRWDVSRAIDPGLDSVAWGFPDWTAIAEFPTLTIEDVMEAAVSNDLLPAGITRFLVPDRALRLNVELELLSSDAGTDQKQDRLDAVIEERVREGRVRRYEETVVILDD
jgi:hypothetical protein